MAKPSKPKKGQQKTGNSNKSSKKTRRNYINIQKTLCTDAIALLNKHPAGIAEESLISLLSNYHGQPHDRVRQAIDQSPRLQRANKMVTLVRSASATSTDEQPPDLSSWAALCDELAFTLTETDLDSVSIEVPVISKSGNGSGATLELRFDVVRSSGSDQIWLAGRVTGPALLGTYVASQPAWTLTAGDQLPLIPAGVNLYSPAIVVWCDSTPREAATRLHDLLGDRLALPVDRIRRADTRCTPRELERRLGIRTTTHRLIERSSRKNDSARSCDRCGKPLSDQASVQLGIGPECLKYYSNEILKAVRKGDPQSIPRPGAKNEREWLSAVRNTWLT